MEVKRRSIIFILITLIVVTSIYSNYQHKFIKERWLNNPEKRALMVNDLLQHYELIGMSEDKVVELLGNEDEQGEEQTSFKGDMAYYAPKDTLIYYLGQDSLDGIWLILYLKNQKVVSISFGVT